MIKERENVITRITQIFQVLLTLGAFISTQTLILATDLKSVMPKESLFLEILIIPLWFITLDYSGICKMYRERSYSHLFFKYVKIIFLGTGIMHLTSLVLGMKRFDFNFWVTFFLIDLAILFFFNSALYHGFRFLRRKGYNTRQILIIADQDSDDFIQKIIHTKDWGYHLWGIIYPSNSIDHNLPSEIKRFTDQAKIEEILEEGIIDEIFYCKGKVNQIEVSNLIQLCSEVGIVFRLKTTVSSNHPLKSKFSFFINEPFFVFRNVPENYLTLKIKRLFDFAFALSALIGLSPVYFLIALAIKLDDGGSAFFTQERVGLNGRRFGCLKFRTMVVNAEALRHQLMNENEQSGPVFKIKMDPRVTRVGRFLRKTSLDELPQFLNVLTGDMSVVGPRPPIPSEVEQYERWQTRRLSMKPGITCIWQVSGRNNIQFEEWVRLDMKYIDNWSLKLDFLIILKTVKVMLLGDGQ